MKAIEFERETGLELAKLTPTGISPHYENIEAYAEQEIAELKDFAIWMTGFGYDFSKSEYFIERRDKLLKS